MTEVRATRANSPELGDVLASIRRLIAQEDAGPDFAPPTLRTDGTGTARSTLPLGPRAEMLRSVIERELSGIELADDRLILGDEARTDDQPTDNNSLPAAAEPALPALSSGGIRGFDEEAYQLARRTSLGRAEGPVAPLSSITPITPQPGANLLPETTAQENEMMLAEVNRVNIKDETDLLQQGAAFDLFAADATNDEDDHLAGGNALRNLVRDVIRQELQGEMGDRISRNLRRVVRQEVAAAISSGLKIN